MIAYSVPLSTDSYPDLVARCLRDIRAESGVVASRNRIVVSCICVHKHASFIIL